MIRTARVPVVRCLRCSRSVVERDARGWLHYPRGTSEAPEAGFMIGSCPNGHVVVWSRDGMQRGESVVATRVTARIVVRTTT